MCWLKVWQLKIDGARFDMMECIALWQLWFGVLE
jgi:hypothetical protein